ncbi:MAG: peptidoglycan DD-metalloendopeptidase family protein [Chromatiaceae bacterium]|nr:peptidoglycan DD-metalloendopeptidase family protein [Chromatiaceae bacterium]
MIYALPLGRDARIKRGFPCLLGCAAALLALQNVAAIETPIENHERDLGLIEQRIETLGSELGIQHEERRALVAELEQREREVAERALAERELERRHAEQRRLGEALAERQRAREAELARALKHLSELVRQAYVLGGRSDRLRALLDQDDPARISRLLSYFAYLNRERLSHIETVRTGAAQLARLREEAEASTRELARLAAEAGAARAALEAARSERAQALAALEVDIATHAEDLHKLETDAEALRQLVEQLRRRAEISVELDIRRESFAARRGRLAWPLLERRILAAFGSRKGGGELHWDGVLLAAREGEEVRAVHDGRVVYADWLRGFGLLLVLDHGDGYLSLYGHNEALTREIGEWVGAGEVIALGGRSGGQSRPVLYFAIRRDGKPQDPVLWCQGRGGAA